ncbi:Protein tyrosine kinase Protein kinase domain [Trypanosoma vivax]|uniref:cyclin-dependent kinase n=1 Tax=Trypanosoma vivax (strain Y486) TaxID=1055687 RepID=G0U1D4_TRYVY|nr:Protein tyrosine kinase Protein kinase domain [Trypanosoma vivax]CCC49889.1 putative protein kinase [Trypanosoma vivax Y486]
MTTINRLQCIEKLGEGTYGVVYKARELATGQVVAFKRIIVGSEDEGAPSTAIREIALLKVLQHNNIVRLHDVLFEPPKLTLIFEYCEFDLRKYMSKHPEQVKLSVKEILKQILLGLQYMHQHSVVHRDLKPENILLRTECTPSPVSGGDQPAHSVANMAVQAAADTIGHAESGRTPGRTDTYVGRTVGSEISPQIVVKLADYGLARVENIPVKKYSHDVASLWYRSPDVVMGSALYSFAVDMWSIGCIFAEVVTGSPLLSGHSDVDQLVRVFQLLGTPTPETWPSMLSYPKTTEILESAAKFVQEKEMTKHAAHGRRSLAGEACSEKTVESEGLHEVVSSPSTGQYVVKGSPKGSSERKDKNHGKNSGRTMKQVKVSYNLPPQLHFPSTLEEYVEASGFRARVGEDGVDMLRQFIRYEPSQRMTAEEALSHPFLRNVEVPLQRSVDIMTSLLRRSMEEQGMLS